MIWKVIAFNKIDMHYRTSSSV